MKGADWAYGRPTGAALVNAGYGFVIRYLDYPGASGKQLTVAEVADYRPAGLGIGTVFESWAERIFEGYPAGVADARQSLLSLAGLGMPTNNQVVFAACDVDVTDAAQLALVDDYLNGMASVLGKRRVGIYGEYDVIDHCWKAGTAAWYWQTTAWSGQRLHPKRHCFQSWPQSTVNGVVVDVNESVGDTGWLWLPEKEEDDMANPAVVRALTGLDGEAADARIEAWNRPRDIDGDGQKDRTGNSLLDGYEKLSERVANLEAAPPPAAIAVAELLEGLAAQLRNRAALKTE